MLVEVSPRERDVLIRTGVAYIVEVGDIDGVEGRSFVGYWESELHDELVIVEKDSWGTYDEALEWGLERADVILITTQDGRTAMYHLP